MTRTGSEGRPPELVERSDSALAWLQLHSRAALFGALLVLGAAGGLWLYRESRLREEANAEQALRAAEQSYLQGNAALAQSDLEKVIARYGGTASAVQAALVLAQIHYAAGAFDKGIAQLQAATTESVSEPYRPALHSLIADGYAEQQRFEEAARHYDEAATASRIETQRISYRADAARAYMAAGKGDEATRIWKELADDPLSPVAPEARLRLGELEARPVTRS